MKEEITKTPQAFEALIVEHLDAIIARQEARKQSSENDSRELWGLGLEIKAECLRDLLADFRDKAVTR
jgi:hypothetical protein